MYPPQGYTTFHRLFEYISKNSCGVFGTILKIHLSEFMYEMRNHQTINPYRTNSMAPLIPHLQINSLTPTERLIVLALVNQPEPLTVPQLAETIGGSSLSTGKVAHAMHDRGLLSRHINHRVVSYSLSITRENPTSAS
jgi:hypothetical protein